MTTIWIITIIVVDNPPFSILAEIVKWYDEENIKFFLFAPALTLFSDTNTDKKTVICANNAITYENGAKIPTGYITNLDDAQIVARTAPDLYKIVEAVNKENGKALRKELPKYIYPDEVLTAAVMHRWSKYGIEFRLNHSDCVKIDALEEQKKVGKSIFGRGFLLSERAAAEKGELSEREWEIVKSLGEEN